MKAEEGLISTIHLSGGVIALSQVIPLPCFYRMQPSGDSSTNAALFFLFKNKTRAGTFSPSLQGSVNWLPSKITEAACLIMIVNDKDHQVYLVKSSGDLQLV